MTEREYELASNALDALDRLFDRECQAVDVWALVEATADAVTPGALADTLREAAARLRKLLYVGLSADEQYARSLDATHELRLLLADVWSKTAPADAAARQARARGH